MRKRINKVSFALSAIGLACLALGAVRVVSAKADDVANTVDAVSYQIEEGASVRLESDGNGIRYQVTMPAAEHTALEANAAYSAVTYGILIAPADYETTYGALDKANVFGLDQSGNAVSAKYDWAVKNEDGAWEYTDKGLVRIMNLQTGKLTEFTAEDGSAMAGYYGSIVGLDEDNVVRDFIGVGYIKYTNAQTGKTDYVFAARNDNVRSMAEVARRALQSDKTSDEDKTTLKETYLEEVYPSYLQFDTEASKQIVTGGNVEWVDLGSGDYAMQALVKNDNAAPVGRTDLTIDVGGAYKVSEIESIVVKYRYMNDAPKATMHLYVNGMDDDVNKRLTGMTYSGDGANWYTPTATNTFATLTIPQSSLKSTTVTTATTLLSDDDYLTSLSFAAPAWREGTGYEAYRVTLQVDSVEINLVPQYDMEHLQFNSEEALGIVTSGLDVRLVDLGDGNKAMQAMFKNDNLDDANTTADDGASSQVNVRIDLGGKYKVSEIESVVIRYKFVQGNAKIYPRVYLNDKNNDTNRPYGDNIVWGAGNTGAPMTEFNTITISNAGLTTNGGGNPVLDGSEYLSSIAFADAALRTDLSWRMIIQIDYIQINLKA